MSTEIVKNLNGIFLHHQGSVQQSIDDCRTIISTFHHGKITKYSKNKYSEAEIRQILEKAENDCNKLSQIKYT